jgi:hypothetical protein
MSEIGGCVGRLTLYKCRQVQAYHELLILWLSVRPDSFC